MNFWNNLSLQLKLQLTIVLFMVITLIFGQLWIQQRFEQQAIKQAKNTIVDSADFIANALTTFMITGVISERKVFLQELAKLKNIEAVHVARNDKVIEQFGKGEGEEGSRDELEKQVMKTSKTVFVEFHKNGKTFLRGIVPIIATENSYGKNCLECHEVPSGYVNGTVSVVIGLEEIQAFIVETETLLWVGQIGWQILLFIIIMFIMQLLLTKPIQRVKDKIKDISQQNDLTLKVEYGQNDELGQIATQTNHLLETLNDEFRKIGADADSVSNFAKSLKESSSQINERSVLQGNKLNDIVAAVEEITRTTSMVAANTTEVASLSEDASQAAIKGGDIIKQTIDAIYYIKETVVSIASTITSLQERSQQIGDITTVIDDIAEQTNLLALNAAIEAARAGEQGRGFAVVADEVRKLAERTSKATQEITERIKSIQAETGKAAEGMQKGQEDVDAGVKNAAEAGESLGQIVNLVEDVSSKISHIATSMEEQKNAIEEIARNVHEVAGHANDNAKDIEGANKVSQEMEHVSADLHNLINTFKYQ
ncbi:MAG: methyl-accepting chemotaxis protein [Nitrospinae bacterium]|nr:methyl-accepting chemotaxis protein [Nitrospinota bacterium]